MTKLRQRLARAESDYAHLEVTNPLLSPVESMLLDFILAANVEADFVNAPPETPFAIWLDDDIVGAGYDPQEAVHEAHHQIVEWELNLRRQARLDIILPPYVLPVQS